MTRDVFNTGTPVRRLNHVTGRYMYGRVYKTTSPLTSSLSVEWWMPKGQKFTRPMLVNRDKCEPLAGHYEFMWWPS